MIRYLLENPAYFRIFQELADDEDLHSDENQPAVAKSDPYEIEDVGAKNKPRQETLLTERDASGNTALHLVFQSQRASIAKYILRTASQ